MSPVLKKSVEIEYGAKRTLLRRQTAELKAKHADLDFENLLRISPVGPFQFLLGPLVLADGIGMTTTVFSLLLPARVSLQSQAARLSAITAHTFHLPIQ